jgi:uncharacterized protein
MTIFGQDKTSMSLHRRSQITTRQYFRLSLTGFLLGSFLVCASSLIIYLAGGIEWASIAFKSGDIFAGLVFMALIAAAEEFIFRGLILRKLSHHINRWLALVISSLLFAAVHLANTNITALAMANIFLGGLVFGITYIASRNLAFVIGFHTAWNFIQGPVLGFPVSGLPFESLLTQELTGNKLINGGGFGLEGSIVCTGVFILFLLAHIKLIPR